MLNKNPYSPRVPLVARESIHTQRLYSLITMNFVKICPENKRIRGRLIGAKSATKGAFENKVLFDNHEVKNINLTAMAGGYVALKVVEPSVSEEVAFAIEAAMVAQYIANEVANRRPPTVPPEQGLPHFGVNTNQSTPEILQRVIDFLNNFKTQIFK